MYEPFLQVASDFKFIVWTMTAAKLPHDQRFQSRRAVQEAQLLTLIKYSIITLDRAADAISDWWATKIHTSEPV